jgi:hypothetical protein
MKIWFPIYVPVSAYEDNKWAKEQSLRTRKIHKLVEEKHELGWKYCFDVPALFSGIVSSISPNSKIGDGLIELNKEQSKLFQDRFNYTTDRILDILETGDMFEEEDELKDLLWGRRVRLGNLLVWRRKKDTDEEEDD